MASRPAASPRLPEEKALDSELPVSRPPTAARYAVGLMVLGAALEVGTAAAALATSNSLGRVFASAGAFDAHDIAVAHGQTIAVNCTVAAALWLTMAYANYRARTDAPRIIAAVLFYLGTEDFAQYFKDPNTAATRAFAVVTWLVGLAVLVLLFSNVVAKAVRNRTARRRAHQLHDATSWVRPQ